MAKSQAKRWVNSPRQFRDFLSLVLLSAPDDFPVEDFLSKEEQLNLEKAFEELNYGLSLLAEKFKDPKTLSELQKTLGSSLSSYRSGDSKVGARLLQEFEFRIFGPPKDGVAALTIRDT